MLKTLQTFCTSARYAINKACLKLSKPFVHGSVYQFNGHFAVFNRNKDAPCYECIFPEPPPKELSPACSTAGVLGVLPGIIGMYQALEVIKLLLNFESENRLNSINLKENLYNILTIKKRTDCSCLR